MWCFESLPQAVVAQWYGGEKGMKEETNTFRAPTMCFTHMSHEIHYHGAQALFTPEFKPWSLGFHSPCSQALAPG